MDKIVTFFTDQRQKSALRIGAARADVSMSDMIRTAIDEYIEHHPEVFFATTAQHATRDEQMTAQEVA